MQVTVNIPDELAAQAIAKGSTPESFVEKLIAEKVAAVEDQPTRKKLTSEEFDAVLDSLAKYSDKIPNLPDEAFTRASFYQDHD